MQPQDGNEEHPAKRLGKKLKEARMAAGYRSQQSFADVIRLHRTTVAKIEAAQRHITPDVLKTWCVLCHVDYELYESSARLAWVTEVAPVPVWFQDFYRAQIMAHTIRAWHPFMIPGPLQTADYARAMHEGAGTLPDLVAERIATRIDLQQRTLDRAPVPVQLFAVMDEAALYRQVGPAEVMHRQLLHLAEQAQRPHIGIQVVPAARGANAGNVGAFTIASIDEADVLLMETVEDVTSDKRVTIRNALTIFDRVRLVASSGPESVELIMKVAESCKP